MFFRSFDTTVFLRKNMGSVARYSRVWLIPVEVFEKIMFFFVAIGSISFFILILVYSKQRMGPLLSPSFPVKHAGCLAEGL